MKHWPKLAENVGKEKKRSINGHVPLTLYFALHIFFIFLVRIGKSSLVLQNANFFWLKNYLITNS